MGTTTDEATWFVQVETTHGTTVVADTNPNQLLEQLQQLLRPDVQLHRDPQAIDAVRHGEGLPQPPGADPQQRLIGNQLQLIAASPLHGPAVATELQQQLQHDLERGRQMTADMMYELPVHTKVCLHAARLLPERWKYGVYVDVWHQADGSLPPGGYTGTHTLTDLAAAAT